MKIHLVNSHACWTDLWPRVLELAALMRRAITKPCIYCLESTFDKQSHWKRCHVITLCCFIELYSRRNDACSVQSHAAPGTPIADGPGAGSKRWPCFNTLSLSVILPLSCLSPAPLPPPNDNAKNRCRQLRRTPPCRKRVELSKRRHRRRARGSRRAKEKAKERTRARAEASQSREILSEATAVRRANCLRRDGSRRLP